MVGHHDVRSARDAQPVGADPASGELRQLLSEGVEVDDRAGADQTYRATIEDARRYAMELEFAHGIDDGMPGVTPTTVTHHDIRVLSQQVSDLAFALVAPLGSHY